MDGISATIVTSIIGAVIAAAGSSYATVIVLRVQMDALKEQVKGMGDALARAHERIDELQSAPRWAGKP